MKRIRLAIISLFASISCFSQINNSDTFNIDIYQNFENNTPGNYHYDECMADWNNPVWVTMDPPTQIIESTDADDPGKYMRFIYPKGSVSLGEIMGGGQWFAPLSKSYNELYFSYRARFIPGFEPVLSGKLPGLMGGPQWPVDTPPDYDDGFAFHFSWNNYPDLVVYIYHQDQPGQSGESWPIGYGIPTDKWITITFRVVMNTVTDGKGNNDGIFETFIDGKLQHQINKLRYRNNESIGIDHLMIESFFGGSGEIWAAIRDEWIEFDDFVAFTYKDNIDVPRGNNLSPDGRILLLPFKKNSDIPVEPEDTNHAPKISNQNFKITCPVKANTSVGKIKATDEDPGQTLKYSLKSGNIDGIFTLNKNTGNLLINKETNYSDTAQYKLIIAVTDSDTVQAMTSQAVIRITVYPRPPTIFIDPANSDSYRNGTEIYPYNSWQEVSWISGYTYLQKKGTTAYEKKINITADNVVLSAYGEGEMPVIKSNAEDYAIRIIEKDNLQISNLQIIANEAICCIYFLGKNTDDFLVGNCILEGTNGGIRVVKGREFTLKYTTLKSAKEAVYSLSSQNNIFYNIFKSNSTAIYFNTSSSTFAKVYNNVFYENTIGINSELELLNVYNNIFYLVHSGDLAINHKNNMVNSDHNIFYPEREGFTYFNNKRYSSIEEIQSELKIDMNSFSKDPEFIDVHNDNFMVNSNSPTVDAGRNVGLSLDYFGNSVPLGIRPDIGLSELQNSVSDLNDDIADDEIILSPNPNDGKFIISFHNYTPVKPEIIIVNFSGQIVYRSEFHSIDNSDINIDLSSLPKGIYLFQIKSDLKIYHKELILY